MLNVYAGCPFCIHRENFYMCKGCYDESAFVYDRYMVRDELNKASGLTDYEKGIQKEMKMLLKNYYINTPNVIFPIIKNVIFNPPATIVLWGDGSKTVVKSGEWDTYDPEKGLAMAISKKALGNKGNYFESFKKWVGEYYESVREDEEYECETCKIVIDPIEAEDN